MCGKLGGKCGKPCGKTRSVFVFAVENTVEKVKSFCKSPRKRAKTGFSTVSWVFARWRKQKEVFSAASPMGGCPRSPPSAGVKVPPPVRNRLKKPLKHDKMGENEPSGGRSAASGGRTWRNSMNWLDKLERK